MKILLKLIVCAFLFTSTSFKSEAKGREVVIFLKDSTEVKGELLAVRDSLVAIAVEPISADVDIAAYPERVKIVKFQEINRVHIRENNNRMTGGLIGLGWGTVSALLFNSSSSGGLVWGRGVPIVPVLLSGGLVGMAIGHLASDNEEDFTFHPDSARDSTQVKLLKEAYTFFIPRNDAIGLLKEHSRFEKSEPAYLRDTIDNLLKETK